MNQKNNKQRPNTDIPKLQEGAPIEGEAPVETSAENPVETPVQGEPPVKDATEEKVPQMQDPKTVDYFGYTFFGLDDSRINQQVNMNPTSKLTLLPLDEAYAKYKPMIDEAGGDISEEDFKGMYDMATARYADYLKQDFNVEINAPVYGQRGRSAFVQANSKFQYSGPVTQSNPFPDWDTRFTIRDGEVEQIKSDEVFAREQDLYLSELPDQTYDQKKARSWVTDEDGEFLQLDAEATQVGEDRGGDKYMVARYSDDKDNWEGNVVTPGPDGNTLMTVDYLPNGRPILREVSVYDALLPQQQVLSAHGAAAHTSNWLGNLWDAGFANTVANVPSGFVGFTDWVWDALDYGGSFINPWNAAGGKYSYQPGVMESNDDFLDNGDLYWKNLASWQTVKTPDDIADEKYYDSFKSFMWHGGAALGSVAQMILTRKSSAAMGKMFGMTDEAAAAFGTNMGSGTMAISAADGFKRSMMENGVSPEMQTLLYLPALVGSFMIERSGANVIDDGVKRFYATQNVKKFVDDASQETLEALGKSSMSDLTQAEAAAMGKNIWQKILHASKTGATKANDLAGKVNFAPSAVAGAVEEGREELIEGRLYNSLEIINDWVRGDEMRTMETDKFTYIQEGTGRGGNLTYYKVDKSTGQKRPITEETYEAGARAQAYKPGEGLMGEYDPNLSVLSNWSDRVMDGWDQDVVMGAFAGGLVAASGPAKIKMQNDVAQYYAITQKTPELMAIYEKMRNNVDRRGYSEFGPTQITPDGTPVDPNDPNSLSMSEVAYQSAVSLSEEAEKTFKQTGITDPKQLAKMMESDEGSNLLQEAYDNSALQIGLQEEITSLNAEMLESEDAEYKKVLQERINEKITQKADLSMQLTEIRDGSRMKEKVANNVIKKFSKDNSLALTDPAGGKVVPGIREIKNLSDRFDEQRAAAVEAASETSTRRSQLENSIEGRIKKMLSSDEVNPTTTENMDKFFEELNTIQQETSQVGLSEKNTKSLLDQLEKKRQAILDGVENYFSEEEVAAAKETAGDMVDYKTDILQNQMAEGEMGSPRRSAYEWSKGIDSAIKSFNVDEASPLKVGDMVQKVDSEGGFVFDQARKLEKIEGDFGFVEGSETGFPLSELRDPDYEGRQIYGSSPSGFSNFIFQEDFYDTYTDTQGNNISISKTLEDVLSRPKSEEDFKTLQMLSEAINNNKYLASLNLNVITPLSKEGELGKFDPSSDFLLNEEWEAQAIYNGLTQKEYLLNEAKSQYTEDINNKKNRESRLRINDFLIRNAILRMAGGVTSVKGYESTASINLLNARIDDMLTEVAEEYKENKVFSVSGLDAVEPLLVEAESELHKLLNEPGQSKVMAEFSAIFRTVKQMSPNSRGKGYHNANEFATKNFDNIFGFNTFIQAYEADKSGIETSGNASATQFAIIYLQNHLQTIQRIDPIKFYNEFAGYISQIESEKGLIPSYEQQRVIHHGVAFMANPNLDVILEIEKNLATPAVAKKTAEMNFNNSLFIRGFAGTGKTSLVVKGISNIYSNMRGSDINIATSAPSPELRKSLNSNLTSFRSNSDQAGMSIQELIQFAGNKDGGILNTDVIIIDEASNLSFQQLSDLRKGLRSSGVSGLRLLFLGDQSQMTSVDAGKGDHLAVERMMERTMPTTEVFRSGAADISNLQTAYRDSIFGDKQAVLPKGTYDKARNNGLQYFAGTKKEMYESFAKDLNSDDSFKKNETTLIVYTKSDREAALNYVRKFTDDPMLDSKIKTIQEGELSAQGLEFGRVIVAISEGDAEHLYNRAMLTAITRAKKTKDNNGYALVLSERGYSEEGEPIIAEIKTSTSDELNRINSLMASISGKELSPETKKTTELSGSKLTEPTQADFEMIRNNLKEISKKKIRKYEDGLMVDGVPFRYTILGKPVISVTEKLKANSSKQSDQSDIKSHALRGDIVHKVVESYLLKQQKKGGVIFTKADNEYLKGKINEYNATVDAWNDITDNELSKLSKIEISETVETDINDNQFIQESIKNVAIPIQKWLKSQGKMSLPESVIGIYYNGLAGTIDIIDLVGMENGIGVIDISDLKTLTPSSNKYFSSSNPTEKVDHGMINSPTGETFYANRLNKALAQLGTYKAMYEAGDTKTGLMPLKVRNVSIIRAEISGNNVMRPITEADIDTYDSNSEPFDKFKRYGKAVLDSGIIGSEKNTRTYDLENEMIGQIYEFKGEGVNGTWEVTGVFTTSEGTFVELDGNKDDVKEMDKFIENMYPVNNEYVPDPTNETPEKLYARSALEFAAGNTFAFGTASAFLQEGENGRTNDHAKFKDEYLKSVANRLEIGNPRAPKVDIIFEPSVDLIDDTDGVLVPFENVLMVKLSEESMFDMVNVAKNYDWAKGKNPQQIIEEIKSRGYDLLGTFRSVESNFGVTEQIDFSNSTEVQRLMDKIKAGFNVAGKKDKYNRQLIDLNTHLAGLRALGAKNPGTPIGTVSIRSLFPGKVVYDKTGENSFKGLKGSLEKKGMSIGDPFFASNLYQKNTEDGQQINVASWAVKVWKISPNVDGSTVVLRTAPYDESHYKDLKKAVDELRGGASTLKTINQSLPYIFLQQNRSYLIDRKTGGFSSKLPGLDDFLRIDGKEINIKTKGNLTPASAITSLSKAIDYLEAERLAKNPLATSLRTAIKFNIGDQNKRTLPKGEETKLFTSATDVQHYGLNINTTTIDTTSITGVNEAGIAPQENDTDDDLKHMGSIDVEDDDGMYMSEKVLDESNPIADNPFNNEDTFFGIAKRFFGDVRVANRVKADVARNLIRYSNWNRDVLGKPYSVSEMIAETMNFYKRLASKLPTSIDVETKDFHYQDLSQISGETAHLLNKKDMAVYFNYVLGKNEDAFIGMVSKLLPSLNLGSMKSSDIGSAMTAIIEGDEAIKLYNENSQGNVIDNLDERPLTDTLSTQVQLVLNHIPLTNYSDVKGEIVKTKTSKNIDAKTIQKSLIDAAAMAHWPSAEYRDLDKSLRWQKALEGIARDAGVGSPKFDNIMSFVDTFFSEDPKDMSHRFIRENYIPNLPWGVDGKMISGLENRFPTAKPETIKLKGTASDNLLSAMYSHFVSAIPRKALQMKIKGLGDRVSYQQKTQSATIGSQVVHGLKSRINNTLFAITDGGLEVSQRVKDALTPGKFQKIDVAANGIFRVDGDKKVKIVSFNTDKTGEITEFSIPNGVIADDIKGIMNVLSLKELVFTSTINSYLNNPKDDNPDVEARKDRSMIAEIVGMMGLTTKASVDPNWSGVKLVDNYFKKHKYDRDSLEDLNEDALLDASVVGKDLYKPTDVYRLLENLGRAQSDYQLDHHSRHYYNVKNKMVQMDMNGSTFFQILNNGDVSGNNPSSGLKNWMAEYASNPENAQSIDLNPLIDDDGRVLNPLLDPNSNISVSDVFITDGTNSSFKSAKQGSDMKDLDLADFQINGNFLDDVLKFRKIERVKLPWHNPANKTNLPVMEWQTDGWYEPIVDPKDENKIIGARMKPETIEKMVTQKFYYHNVAREKSYRKWSEFFAELGVVVDQDHLDAWMEDPINFQIYLDDVQKRIPELSDYVKRSTKLMLRNDYKITKSGVQAGNVPTFNVDSVYNFKNFSRLKKARSSEDAMHDMYVAEQTDERLLNASEEDYENVRATIEAELAEGTKTPIELIKGMFFQRNMNAAVQLASIGFKLNPKLADTSLWKYQKGSGEKPVINEALEAYLFAYHFADSMVSQVMMGDTTQYKDVKDVYKRSTGPVAAGWAPDTSSPSGIGKKSSAVILQDLSGHYDQLSNIFGHDGNYLKTDGLGIPNPIWDVLFKNSYGGKELGVIGEGMMKPVYDKNDLTRNEAVYFKYALLPITQETLENSPMAREMFRKMAGNELFSMWQNGSTFEELADFVNANPEMKSQMHSMAVFMSGTKTGIKGVQTVDDAEWSTSIEIDNDYLRIQLNASQDVTEVDLSVPTQLSALAGIGSNNYNRISRFNKLKAEIGNAGFSEIEAKFTTDGQFNKEDFFAYLRENGIKSADNIDDIGMFAEILHNENIDLNIPTARPKLFQQLMNKLTDRAIKPKWNGVRMSQAPSVFFSMYEDAFGNRFMEAEAERYGVETAEGRELTPMLFYSDPEFTNEIQSREEFDQRVESGEVYVKPGEIIMPFSYFKQFGFDEYANSHPGFSLNDVLMIQLPGKEFPTSIREIMAKTDEEGFNNVINDAFASMKEEEIKPDTFLQQTFSSPEKATEFLNNFLESLKILNNRIPTSSTSGAFIGEVVGWINDNGNTIYTSAAKNILDGGDYDIDQLNTYFQSVDAQGKINKDGVKGKGNEMFNILYEYYNDPKNADLFMSPISLDSLHARVDAIGKKMDKFVNDQNDYGSNIFFEDKITSGDALIGVFANIIKQYSYLSHVSNENPDIAKKMNVTPEVLNQTGDYIINVLEKFMNAAMDNAKEMILGDLGATEDAGNLIGAASIMGKSEDDVINLLNSDAVVEVFRKVKYSKRVNNARKLNVIDAIEAKMTDLEGDQTEARTELDKKLFNLDVLLAQDPNDIIVDNVIIHDNGDVEVLSSSSIKAVQNGMLTQWDGERKEVQQQILDFAPYAEKQMADLNEMLTLAYAGEALSRLNTITKIDSQGLPVFDYKFDKQLRDIEFNMGMPIAAFLAGNSADSNWYKGQRGYMTEEDFEKFVQKEEAIRSFIDIPAVVNGLPQIQSYLNIMNESSKWIQNSFIRNSKVVQGFVETYLNENKLDWFPSEQAYYSFYKELDAFLVSIYFGSKFKGDRYQSVSGLGIGSEMINIGTPQGRFQFGMEFPDAIINELEAARNTPKNERNEKEKIMVSNLFLGEVMINSTPTGNFLEFKNASKLSDEDLADRRASFKLLPEDIKERFRTYQLAKDGFSFKKGGLYEAMDEKLFEDYSIFLDTISDEIDPNVNTKGITMIKEDGKTEQFPLAQMVNTSFLNDVGYYSDDMSLVRWGKEDWKFAPEPTTPNQFKVTDKSTKGFNLVRLWDMQAGSYLQAKAKQTFNGYDPLNSQLTKQTVLKRLSHDNYMKIRKNVPIVVRFNEVPTYSQGDNLFLPDGTQAVITNKSGKSITLRKISGNTPMGQYKAEFDKKKTLELITQNSENEAHKELAQMILTNVGAKALSIGKISYESNSTNEGFAKMKEDGMKTYGVYYKNSRQIIINQSSADTQAKMEQALLHEHVHNITADALDLTISELNNMEPVSREAARNFKNDIDKLYNHVKEAAKGTEWAEKNALKNQDEFVAEGLTNGAFQKFLNTVPAAEGLNVDQGAIAKAWTSFVNAIKDLLGLGDNGYTALDQVINVSSKFSNEFDFSNEMSPGTGVNKRYYSAEPVDAVSEVEGSMDIINALQPTGVIKNYSQYKEEELVSSIYSRINFASKMYYYNGEKFYFRTKDGEMMDELSAKALIRKDILPKFTEFETNYKNSVIDWMNSGASETGSSPKAYFPKKGGQESRYAPSVLAEFKRLIDWDTNDKYIRYSDLKNSGMYPNIPHIKEFEGHDPIIVIHESVDESNQSISIFDATSLRLGKKGMLSGNFMKSYISSDMEALNEGINLGNNEGDLRKLLIGVQAMAMKKANPGLKIKHMGVLGVKSSGIESTWVYMPDFVGNIKAMKKVPAFYSKFSDTMQEVLNDPALYEDVYEQPWIHMMKRKFNERLLELKDIDGQEMNLKRTYDAIGQIEAYINGDGSKEQTLEMLIQRQHELENSLEMNEEQLMHNQEYVYLSATIKEMSSKNSINPISTKDLDKVRAISLNSHSIEHDVVNWVQEKIMNGKNFVQDKVWNWQKNKLWPVLKAYDDRYFKRQPNERASRAGGLFIDASGKKFAPLFKTTTAKDLEGNTQTINSMEIHWDINDEATITAMRTNKISKSDVEFGKFIVDTIEDQMIQNLMHAHRYEVGRKYTKEDAKKELDLKWRKGMIPAMSASVNQMLMKGLSEGVKGKDSRKAAWAKFQDQLTNYEDQFDESGVKASRDSKRQRILKEMGDFFMHQIGTDSEEFGSDSRMGLMGLTNDDIGGPILVDPVANKNLSMNLELTIMYMVASSERKRHFDKKVLPFTNAGQVMLHNYEVAKLDGDQSNAIKYMQTTINSLIKGQAETLDSKVTLLGKEREVDKLVNMAVRITSFNGLAWNIPVGITSAVMNSGQFMNNAIANQVANNGFYTRKEANQAIQMFSKKKGREFIEGVMQMYKVADMTERDLTNNPRKRITNKNIFTSHSTQWMNWWSDYNIRGIVAVSQMIKDGSIEAYSMKNGELVYDESKDKRWQGEDGKVLKANIKDKLVEDGYMESIEDPMPRGYDNREARVLKWLSDKFIIGGMDETTRTAMSRYTAAQPFMQFASYLPDKVTNYFGKTMYSPVGGSYKVITNKAGETETVWQEYVQEGIMKTVTKLYQDVRKNGFKDMKSWSEMKPEERRNVVKLSADLASAALLFTLYYGLTAIDWDDEEPLIKDSRFIRIIKYAAMDYLLFNPMAIAETVAAVPSIEQAKRISNIFIGDFSKLDKSLPLSTSINAIGELIPESEE